MPYDISQYLDLTLADARAQWRSILARAVVGPGQNQVDYVPLETLLCAAAMVELGSVSYGSGLAAKQQTPIPQLADVFRRRPTSITSKMANLEGGRSRGGKSDQRLWEVLRHDHGRLFDLYRLTLAAARHAGVEQDELPTSSASSTRRRARQPAPRLRRDPVPTDEAPVDVPQGAGLRRGLNRC